ncbi:MAG: sirohydrochlorin chelatase [Pirellulales bacterium]
MTGRTAAAAHAPRVGILLVGHGTREPAGVAQFLELARRFAGALPGSAVEHCFLELAEPTIALGLERLLSRGIDELVVAPLLLFSAGHAKEDIPAAVSVALSALGRADLTRRQTPPLECHPELLALSRERFLDVAGHGAEASTTLVMIGRGSRDAEATQQMHRYAALHAAQLDLPPPVVGFLAVARPNLGQALELTATRASERVVVQPHLLFEGLLAAEVRAAVADAQRRWPQIDWRCTAPLGPQLGVVRALCSMAGLDEVTSAGQFASLATTPLPDNP